MINKLEFKAFIIEKFNGKFIGKVKYKTIGSLPSESLLIKISYSSLNYKDALSSIGSKGITNNYPHTPGIDAISTVVECNNNQFKKGEKVIVTGHDLGMNTDDGFAEYIQVPSSWAIQLPENLSEKEAAIYGTAGLTAGMSAFYLTKNIDNDKPVVVSGASGGVGSISISILNKLGYKVAAITSKEYEKEYLLNLGANEIISINDIEKNSTSKPLLKSLFSDAIDTVGGNVLEYIIKSTKPMGIVTCCGNAKSSELV